MSRGSDYINDKNKQEKRAPVKCSNTPTATSVYMLTLRPKHIITPVARFLRSGRMIPTQCADDAIGAPMRCAPPNIEAVPPAILYLSDDFVLIDKPCDVRMDGDFPVTIEKLVQKWVTDVTNAPPHTRLIHQLDFATSGVLCMGLTKAATAVASKAFHDRLTSKCYLAVLQGHLDPSLYPTLSSHPIPPRTTTSVNATKHQPETWQAAARDSLLTAYFTALHQIPPHPEDTQLSQLLEVSRETFLASAKLRKQMRKVVQRYGIAVDVPPREEVENVAIMIDRERSDSVTSNQSEDEIEPDAGITDYCVPSHLDVSTYASETPPFYQLAKDACSATSTTCHNSTKRSRPSSSSSLFINLPIASIANDFRMRWGTEPTDGRSAQTQLDVLRHGYMRTSTGDVKVTKVLLTPKSGRRHQLRLHCLALGHPIVGDGTYNLHQDTDNAPRMMLHAHTLKIDLAAALVTGVRLRGKKPTHLPAEINATAPDPFLFDEKGYLQVVMPPYIDSRESVVDSSDVLA